ncbi:MAG: hypothetical protein OXE41_03175 [Gammaproteobacteria bacterium]|nr:hypothetical protein [Gammaproteobacteria bacterium]MCY4218929.1 hypothetical protein [Gammaproteobacteria bacterium]MCY4274387.1 hypothetical protein [Gammaproteobacteria bacterium]
MINKLLHNSLKKDRNRKDPIHLTGMLFDRKERDWLDVRVE